MILFARIINFLDRLKILSCSLLCIITKEIRKLLTSLSTIGDAKRCKLLTALRSKKIFCKDTLTLIVAFLALWVAWLTYTKVDVTAEKLQILELADKCMWFRPDGGDYSAYEELLEKIKNDRLKDFARKQLLRINTSFYFSYPAAENIPLCKSGKVGIDVLNRKPKKGSMFLMLLPKSSILSFGLLV